MFVRTNKPSKAAVFSDAAHPTGTESALEEHGKALAELNILFLTHRVPHPPDRGDRIRSFHVLKMLAKHGRVHLGCLADEAPSEGSLAQLRSLCSEHLIVLQSGFRQWSRAAAAVVRGRSATERLFWSPKLARQVNEWTGRIAFDAAVLFCSGMGVYQQAFSRRPRRLIVDLVDVDSEKWLDYAATAKGWKRRLYAAEGRRLRRWERTLAQHADAVTLVSQSEADLFHDIVPEGRSLAVTNGVDLEYFHHSGQESPSQSVVFVGALDYFPNVQGVLWFAKEVWPEVKAGFPDAEFVVVGRNPSTEVRRLSVLPSVRIVGQVADVRPHLASASIVVAPLHIARGIQNKVLEAMAMSKAVVASTGALTGLNARDGVDLLKADGARRWIGRLHRLFDDPALRRSLGDRARAYVETHHSWERCLAPMAALAGLTGEDCDSADEPQAVSSGSPTASPAYCAGAPAARSR